MSTKNRGPRIRINNMIRAGEVRLIAQDGQMLGVVPLRTALGEAEKVGLDLIEVAPEAKPPVCRLYSYSKWKYEADQKAKEKRKNHTETKEFKFNVRIGEGDIVIKCRKIAEALTDGNRVRVVVQMRGRERSHPELARELMNRILKDVGERGALEGSVHGDTGQFSAQILPKKR